MMYAQNAISVNEFLGHSWSQVIPDLNPFLRLVAKAHCGSNLLA